MVQECWGTFSHGAFGPSNANVSAGEAWAPKADFFLFIPQFFAKLEAQSDFLYYFA